MTRRFEDLPWHDAVVLSIEIPRRRPGVADEVLLSMLWPDGHHSTVAFSDCFALIATMNFGIVAAETVRSATEHDDDDDLLQRQRAKWSHLGVDLSGLKRFTLETNSTASTLVVLALAWAERDNDAVPETK
ncbi:MAG: hypothetical protein IPH07_14610 [Deltaproteobacteria bacterium]|nr:hypothetical protein [Deltaproteobacteria bacterium]MBK8717523.1 hypothetical protein [Deltaproteobacteria bacterium]